jgi:purine-nucleoside phosphorylase
MNAAERTLENLRAACRHHRPEAFVVLGSGLGVLAKRFSPLASVPFAALPGLSATGVMGHRGLLSLVRWAGRIVLVSEGRLHYYEGHSRQTVCRLVRLAGELGAPVALLTNAAGGIRDDLQPGTLLPLRDQIEWNLPTPWRVAPQLSPYCPELLRYISSLSPHSNPPPQGGRESLPPLVGIAPAGVYAGVSGPCYETPAEIRALRSVGADAVGMSTVWEARAAVALGMRCAAISLITNRAAGLSSSTLSHQEVMAVGQQAATRLGDLLEAILGYLPSTC